MVAFGAIHKASELVDRAATVLIVALLAAMTVVTFSQIIFRVFFTALIWSEEIARYMLVWLTFIGAGSVHKRMGHISIDLLRNALPAKVQKPFQIVTHLICVVAFVVVVYFGIAYIQVTQAQLSAAMRIPMWYAYIAMPIGGATMLLHSVSHILKILVKERVAAQ